MTINKKDILGIAELSRDEITSILDTASIMKRIIQSGDKKTNYLRGKTVLILFYENSTRTRVSFELAAKYMGADTININVSVSSVAKGETLVDTGKTLNSMGADVIVIRHNMSGAPHLLAKHVNASVINAGDGMHEHPTQALLDMFTIREYYKTLSGLKVAIIGDIYHSRVARSNIIGLAKMGAKPVIYGPATLIPPEIEKMGAKIAPTINDALYQADVVMGLRMQLERQKNALFPSKSEYARFFGINQVNLSLAKKDALWMHPGPVNRGVEMTSGVIDGFNSVINEQVTNGVAVRMALLYLLAGRENMKVSRHASGTVDIPVQEACV
ncbi:aspartate carbamoyltransferase PyrB [Thermoclostridium stercorarium subsp. stercorarium DSM 8532]|uniref:Aspartate carbamoyltransferase n=3 Tax=Thermoclostridium stercorarium TaxID=1510 RepID=L7VQI9_THES1|nr:aspartate carbamoyltransferase catalytic subunit [Thermoclostridium stercorarium]AGC69072.1 aspartate carbamoyltransferase PyrB [Thermoclostridium stercorarium subsp. stercorarium DSM 8532]AGI40045.1 aspartate carbamoyltransferase [Thermoclostridium stercorarium subsp. stercorarium DSM 8532]ANW99364.1 aspartate carbamoyltransferase [Thermoclostridium stercorarium subsp. thermolacticum DSM 2910]ANX01994.1 aspartate carbamoyltransferase [Thermoclostridium stercorarium subsp. leptospartum DSM 9